MILRAVSFCLCTGLAGISAMVLGAEASNHKAVAASQLNGLAIGVSNPLPLPFSHQRLFATLDICARAMRPGYASFFGAAQLQTTQRHCMDFTRRAEKYWPNNGLIGLTRASHAASLGDVARFQAEISRAQRNAPNQGWQAMRRVDLTLDLSETLQTQPGALSPVLPRDLSVMLTIQPGAESLVEYFHTAPLIRPAITTALHNAAPADQKRFVNLSRLRGYE